MKIATDNLVQGYGITQARAEQWTPFVQAAMDEFEIDNPKRVAAFLAQIGHESMLFRTTVELWGPTPSQRRYERDFTQPWPRNDVEARLQRFAVNKLAFTLGNSEVGDGSKYRGHGLIQITGRGNHKLCGDALGCDFITSPELLGLSKSASRSAGWFWKWKNLNPYADLGSLDAFRHITLRINGGPNGAMEREALWNRFNLIFKGQS